jgi:hypothetical protein
MLNTDEDSSSFRCIIFTLVLNLSTELPYYYYRSVVLNTRKKFGQERIELFSIFGQISTFSVYRQILLVLPAPKTLSSKPPRSRVEYPILILY